MRGAGRRQVGMIQAKINIVLGEYAVSSRDDAVISTLLGSCVAACVFDTSARLGGMNHFLLPGDTDGNQLGARSRYGVYLMEMLINGLLKAGATKQSLRAKVFGGANTVAGLGDIGEGNVRFAREFLMNEGIGIIGGDTGGHLGRRIEFWPASGRARQVLMQPVPETRVRPEIPMGISGNAGELELF
jgi:chemotaxis protein CheD